LTNIYQSAGHHIPEDLYLNGIFITVLGTTGGADPEATYNLGLILKTKL
jgi:hypothetical protein